jgi:hypothetical protein
MTPFSANPFIFIFSVVVLCAVALYCGYIAFDGWGLEIDQQKATVTHKQHYAGSEAPVVTIAAGRPWVQSQLTPEVFLLELKSDTTAIHAAVTKTVFDAVTPGDTVSIKFQRRRISGRLEVVEVLQ